MNTNLMVALLAALAGMAERLRRVALRWLSRAWNTLRLLDLPAHRRRVRRSRRVLANLRAIRGEAQGARRFAYLRTVDPLCMEEVVLSALEQGGRLVRRNRRYSGDGGVDGLVRIDGSWQLVQVKRYRAHVACAHVAELAALVARHRAGGALFVHCRRSGKAVYQALRGTPVALVSGAALLALLEDGCLPARAGTAAALARTVRRQGGASAARRRSSARGLGQR